MPYFWLSAPAVRTPEATWSPWRWRKLLRVPAAERASAMLTEDGSLWKLDAVRRAACFCAMVVPSADGVLVAP
ncbi:hypothetical protein VDGD_20745 [Verticillium dahliae]|nr:hypothetical protein VDGD_20745 [Verticillium dahliae]